VRVSIADLGLQSNIRKGLAQLLELRNGLRLVCDALALNCSARRFPRRTRLRKAVADHIIDVQVRLERLGFRHDSRGACVVNEGVFEVVDGRSCAREARNARCG
jgi:hypothetical protein